MNRTTLLAILLTLFALLGCGESKITGSYKPEFLPIKINVDSTGEVSVSWDRSIATPIGVFSIGVSSALSQPEREGELVVLVSRNGIIEKALVVRGDGRLQATVVGTARFAIEKNRVEIDVSGATVSYGTPRPAFTPRPRSPPPTGGRTAIVNFARPDPHANLRGGPSRSTEKLAEVPRGSRVTQLGSSRPDEGVDTGRWYHVSFAGMDGWLHENSLEWE